ncbi:hypothetical protein SAMN05421636_103266 [Pricia antarctica]|uniref:Uncharacterized protein n=1 Tax=Pricia antarctica TaxID=641691 RepID=A0A1G7A9Z9_9FLAO|nr:hypothetical protein SAMN05421636_103266 [Pricia antarctica]
MKLLKYRRILFLALFFAMGQFVFGHDGQMYESGSGLGEFAGQQGIGLGSAIAVVASWSRNKSILWAILHGFLGWIYVIYFAITRSNKLEV